METTGATAMLVGTRDMLAAYPNAVTTTIARGEIEEALSSELPTELILDVHRPASAGMGAETRTVTVAWDRADLESLLADTEADAMTFSFEPDALERAFDEPEFEGHGIRETAMIITVAAAAAFGASTASGMPFQEQGGPSTVSVTAVSTAVHDEVTVAARGIEAPFAVGDSGSGIEFPSLDAPAAVAVGAGLAGAGLLIAAAMFTAGRRNRIRPL